MTTTAMHMGSKFSETSLRDGWGDLNDEQIDVVSNEIVSRFNEKTGLNWIPSTSEVIRDINDDRWDDNDDLIDIKRQISEEVFENQQAIIEAAGVKW